LWSNSLFAREEVGLLLLRNERHIKSQFLRGKDEHQGHDSLKNLTKAGCVRNLILEHADRLNVSGSEEEIEEVLV
jgi:hypothetical protein